MQIYIIYLFGFIDPNALANFLNSNSRIRNWYQYGNVLAVLSTYTLSEMQAAFMPFFFGQTFVIVPAVGATTGGNMPADFWKFINEPKDSGVWPPLQSNGESDISPWVPGFKKGIMKGLAGINWESNNVGQ